MSDPVAPHQPIRVLLVEDAAEQIRTIWNMLHERSKFHYQVEAVTGLPEAVERLATLDIDVVLLDLSLISHEDETDAVEMVLRAQPDIALLVLTELENEEAGLRALEAGAQDYLLKEEMGTRTMVRALHYAVERQRAETRARTADERLRATTNSIVDYAIVSLDSEGHITDWSIGAQHVFGYRAEEIVGEHVQRLFTPEDKAAAVPEQELGKARTQGFAEDRRWHLRQGDKRFFGSGMTRPVYDAAQRIRGYVKIVSDVTERHQAEQALRESEAKYNTLCDTIDEGFCVIEVLFDEHDEPIDFRFVEANRAFERQTDIQNAVGRRMRDIAPQHEAHWFEIFGKVALTGEPVRFENPAAELNRYYEVYAFRVGEPAERKVGILFNDISKRVHAESALHESEAQYRELFNSMTEGFCVIEKVEAEAGAPADFRYVEANAAFFAQTGASDVIGKTILQVFPQEPEEWFSIYDTVLRTGEPIQFERELVTAGRILELHAFRVKDKTHRRVGVVFMDITERKRQEAAERDQRVLAEVLRETGEKLSSVLQLEDVLEQAVLLARELVPYDIACVVLVEHGRLIQLQSAGFTAEEIRVLEKWHRRRGDLSGRLLYRSATRGKQPMLLNNRRASRGLPLPLKSACSLIVVPLISENTVVGYLTLCSQTTNRFVASDIPKLQAFAYQVVAAISNARRFLQAQELGALHERQQFARDLHDAVSQTLFSASLLVDALPHQLEHNPLEIPAILVDLNRQIKGAQAELRTLLLELRPTKIQSTPFTTLVQQLVAAAQVRKRLAVTLGYEGQPSLPPEVHVAIYRIAQEALSNITKHARATEVWIEGQGRPGYIDLRIRDNGVGFSEGVPTSGMGLQIMKERAAEIGARLDVNSSIGKGTEIHLVWPHPK